MVWVPSLSVEDVNVQGMTMDDPFTGSAGVEKLSIHRHICYSILFHTLELLRLE